MNSRTGAGGPPCTDRGPFGLARGPCQGAPLILGAMHQGYGRGQAQGAGAGLPWPFGVLVFPDSGLLLAVYPLIGSVLVAGLLVPDLPGDHPAHHSGVYRVLKGGLAGQGFFEGPDEQRARGHVVSSGCQAGPSLLLSVAPRQGPPGVKTGAPSVRRVACVGVWACRGAGRDPSNGWGLVLTPGGSRDNDRSQGGGAPSRTAYHSRGGLPGRTGPVIPSFSLTGETRGCFHAPC